MAGFAAGTLRTMHIEKDCIADLIPVDVVINAMIVAAWKTAQDYTGNPAIPSVYNVTSSSVKPLTWGKYYRYVDNFYWKSYITNIFFFKGESHQAMMSSILKYPLSNMLW